MSRPGSSGTRLIAVAVLGTVAVGVAGSLVLARTNPDSTPARYVEAAESVARDLPMLARQAIQEAKNRFAAAKLAFREARAESERSLMAQFQEAKQRGSVPPL